MTSDVRRRYLDPFFTTKKQGLSTGMGMGLVRSVAEEASGSLRIESAPGRGATITLRLPIAA